MWALTRTRRLRAGLCCKKNRKKRFFPEEKVPEEGGLYADL
jgi:hypothetical protein